MGGDFAPKVPVEGACLAVKQYPFIVTLVGKKDLIQAELDRIGDYPKDKIIIHDATDVVTMSESPTTSYKSKPNSSIRVGLTLVKEGKADGFVSAGNTGAVMFASIMVLGRIKGVERPAICGIIPSQTGPFLLLDMGSNVDSKPSHLAQFALMGHHFSREILGKKEPKVALLNIGEEEDKGDSLTTATYPLLKQSNLNFIGNIEGKELMSSEVDVVVCDGFVGNTVLKFGEGVSKMFTNFFKSAAKKSIFSLLGLLLLRPALKEFKSQFDYDEYGGAPLLGIDGVSIIAHGSASSKAIMNALRTAVREKEGKVVDRIKEALQ